MNKESQVMAINELNRMNRLIEQRERTLKRYNTLIRSEKRVSKYGINLQFAAGNTDELTKQLTIKELFLFNSIESVVVMEGVLSSGTGPGTSSVCFEDRQKVFDFYWKIRELGGEEWVSEWQPSIFLMNGAYRPFILKSPQILENSVLEISVRPFHSKTSGHIYSTISKYSVYMGLSGHSLVEG